MIHPLSISKDWILSKAKENKTDPILVQKVIRALMLLEGLSESKIQFVFKGGTALMLLLGSTKRLSIDIDIIVPKKTEIDEQLEQIVKNKGFIRVEPQHRSAIGNIEKAHYKFYFENALKTDSEDYILLDVLFEAVLYQNTIETSIASKFLMQEEEPLKVWTPDFDNIMGDKMTAFAPNTIGIPYIKKEQPMGLEIIKQLYDVGNIFPNITRVDIVSRVFIDIAQIELSYRELRNELQLVFDDIFENCLSICLRSSFGNANFDILQKGIIQADSYIFSERYHLEKAITHAARTAFMAALIEFRQPIQFFQPSTDMSSWSIDAPFQALNKIKKTNPEAFFYWYQCLLLKHLK